MMFSGALERHPGLQLVLAESGIGWLPVLPRPHGPASGTSLARQARLRAERSPPSELFRRQVIATFEEEPLGHAAHPAARRRLVHVGVRLSAHRQHVPALATARSRRRSARCPPTTVRKVTATNCARLYGFPHAMAVTGPVMGGPSAASTTCRCRCSDTDAMVRSTAPSASTSPSTPHVVSVLRRPADDQLPPSRDLAPGGFTLRAPARGATVRRPVLRVGGSARSALRATLRANGIAESTRGRSTRGGGRRERASSVYVRDPDGNLLEFMIYRDGETP